MSDKKHIDRLFQERFKDFEATPGDAVWENIEAQLNQKKKKRRVIPVWWRYAGVAALLLLLLTVGFQLFNNDNEIPTNQVVETEDATSIELKTNDSDALDDSNNINSDTNNTVIADTNTENEALNNEETHQTKLEEASDNVIKASKTTSVAENVSSKNKNESKLNTASVSNEKFNASILNTENKTAIASNSEEKNKTIHQNKTDKSLIDKNKLDTISAETNKINNAIAEVKKEEKTELIADNNSIENTLTIEEELNKNKDIIEEEKNLNRWSVAANAAPVYFNSLGNGSSIDAQFNNNPKSSDLNMSYGIKASYAVNKKLRIRSGINKVNLGYSTNNVVVFQSIGSNSSSFQNVNSSGDVPENVSIISGANLSSAKAPDAFAKSSNTSLNQEFGYIEVPLEIQYALTNKKLGVNVIGGFSSFFLNKNEIFSESAGSRTLLGEANNINKVSYSANFGLGLNYKFSKKIDLNLEPMFKYQINTFNNTSGDFKPYFIGVYTGFAIKF